MHEKLRGEIYQLHAEFCQALSDPKRILILYELGHGPSNVGDLAERLSLSQPTVSRHLKVLRDRRMVRAARDGTNVYYSIADRRVLEALDLLRGVLTTSLREDRALAGELA